MVKSLTKTVAVAAVACMAAAIGPASSKAEMVPTGVMKIAPGQSAESIAPAVTVLSTSHYQAMLSLNCSFHACYGSFPKVAAKRRINVTRLSCTITSQSANSVFGIGRAQLYSATSTLLGSQELVHVHTNPAGIHGVNDAIDLLALSGQNFYVYLLLTNDTATSANCMISGTMDVLG